MKHDQSGEYPHELHAALAKDGWIGIALPTELGGGGLGISEATMMLHTIAEYLTHPNSLWFSSMIFPNAFLLLILGNPIVLVNCLLILHYRSGAGIAGAQSIHANVYATQVGSHLNRFVPQVDPNDDSPSPNSRQRNNENACFPNSSVENGEHVLECGSFPSPKYIMDFDLGLLVAQSLTQA